MKRADAPAFDKAELNSALSALGTDGQAAALSALCAAAKAKAAREYIDRTVSRDKLYAALTGADPKARKNAARLVGALEKQVDVPALIDALSREETRFVRPSMILALGALGGEAAAAYLLALPEPQANDPTEEKHAREEAEALRRARARLTPAKTHAFTGFTRPHSAIVTAPAGFAPLLQAELAALSITARPAGEDTLSLAVQDVKALYRARCFNELLFPLADGIDMRPEAVAKAVRVPFLSLLQDALAGEPPYAYRVECPDIPDRAAFISALAHALDGNELLNSPSQYEAELRLAVQENGNLRALCKLYPITDPRFLYRKRAIPASMHPATAACVARYAAGYAKNVRRVLDPFCGSGTLLIEWARIKPNCELTGVDIVRGTLDIAKENMEAAGVRAGLVHKDSVGFVARAPYDLVLSNLPFGNRVGTHKENEALYFALCEKLNEWLAPGGVAVLYTMEYSLLSRCLKKQPGLKRVGETRTAAGGLLPWVFMVKREH